MLYPIQEENIIEQLEVLSDHDEVAEITFAYEDDEYDIYVAEMVSGREFFIIFNQQPLAFLAKSNICKNANDALEIYLSYHEE